MQIGVRLVGFEFLGAHDAQNVDAVSVLEISL
jgi:hypothetical protein